MKEQLLTPSKVTAWLDCARSLTLANAVAAGDMEKPDVRFGSFAQLLVDKGLQHESSVLDLCHSLGLSVLDVPQRSERETFASWVDRVSPGISGDHDLIYQMPFVHQGIRGVADFLRRVEGDDGIVRWEPVDAKLARNEAKPGHVLQLCFYAEAIEALTGHRPEHMHLWLGSDEVETIRTDDVMPYWNRLRAELVALLASDPSESATHPEPNDHCQFCEFAEHCESEWRAEDSLVFVTDLTTRDREVLRTGGVTTLDGLAGRTDPVEAVTDIRLKRWVDQAGLQKAARDQQPLTPPFRLIEEVENEPVWGHGFEQLPEPDDGDVFLDFEGHPFWTAATGLFFLFGYVAQDAGGEWAYTEMWAHNLEEEKAATRDLIDFLSERRTKFPKMHVYHYNHTERSSLERLTAEHGVDGSTLDSLIQTGLFVDLLTVVRNALQVGVEGRSLKVIEHLTGYVRQHGIEKGSGAVVEYEGYMADRSDGRLEQIARYNEDDVRATMALRDWLVAERPGDLEWREAVVAGEDPKPELDKLVERLSAYPAGSAEHVLSELLGYWVREYRAYKTPKIAMASLDTASALDEPDLIGGLVSLGIEERTGKNGRTVTPAMRFTFAEQTVDEAFAKAEVEVMYGTLGEPTGYARIASFDPVARELLLVWNETSQELPIPSSVVIHDWVRPEPKPGALTALATEVVESGAPNEASLALLRRDLPRFAPGHGPQGGVFTTDLGDMKSWVRHLDRTCVAIQGPPGTGKTYRGAHLVHSLVTNGARVGITAMSHSAIDNLLKETVKVFTEAGDLDRLRPVRRVPKGYPGELEAVEYTESNDQSAKPEYNLVAGTTWLFSGKNMRNAPVDVLLVDEAGQLSLADAVAASTSASSVILLGDPLQLAQVSQASHPHFGGLSVLEHVLGDDVTIKSDRGVFLDETWRMHPDIAEFISDRVYEGRLTTHPDCATQDTEFGTGLRWLRAEHDGCSTESAEEAELIAAEIERLIGTKWTAMSGEVTKLALNDFMVVAPYNDQVDLLRRRLDANEATRGVPVGTVDKFQGREAPVVFYSMTASSSDEIKRGPEFLFSQNRFNVAISRARCLAYLVCTDRLLSSRARDLETMKLIATVCSFVEYADAQRHRRGESPESR